MITLLEFLLKKHIETQINDHLDYIAQCVFDNIGISYERITNNSILVPDPARSPRSVSSIEGKSIKIPIYNRLEGKNIIKKLKTSLDILLDNNFTCVLLPKVEGYRYYNLSTKTVVVLGINENTVKNFYLNISISDDIYDYFKEKEES